MATTPRKVVKPLDRDPICEINKAEKTLTIIDTGEVIPMKDLQKHVAFHIRPTHLKNGIPRDPCHCGISNAITSATGAELVVTLASIVIYVVKEADGKVAYRGRHSTSSRAIVRANDLGAITAPPHGHFFIQPPDIWSSLKYTKRVNRLHKQAYETKRDNPSRKKPRSYSRTAGIRSGVGHRVF
jgi:hypothetical protein